MDDFIFRVITCKRLSQRLTTDKKSPKANHDQWIFKVFTSCRQDCSVCSVDNLHPVSQESTMQITTGFGTQATVIVFFKCRKCVNAHSRMFAGGSLSKQRLSRCRRRLTRCSYFTYQKGSDETWFLRPDKDRMQPCGKKSISYDT